MSRDGRRSSGEVVKITTMGGKINVEEAPAGANVSTMGGDIRIRSAGEFVGAKTMGGHLRIDAIDGRVKGTTMAGDIRVVMVGDPSRGDREVDLQSYSGDVELTVPRGLAMSIDVEIAYIKGSSRDFRIVSDFPLEQTESREWDRSQGSPRRFLQGTGTVGSGEHRVRIRTVNGNVHLIEGDR